MGKKQRQRIFYSGFGTSDPVRDDHDSGLMRIMRLYRPEAVYLFLTKEIVALDKTDDRIAKTFRYIQEEWDGYSPEVIRMETDIQDPSNMDVLEKPMLELFQRAVKEHPDAEILINLSSGTPQMQFLMSLFALDSRYRGRGIQVLNPKRKSGDADRLNHPHYPIDEALQSNEDEKEKLPELDKMSAEKLEEIARVREPELMAMRRTAVREQLKALVAQRNYAAIARMGADLPASALKLAQHLEDRSNFQLEEAEKKASEVKGVRLQAGKGIYPQPIYEMLEYFAILKNLVYLKRYTDFMLRLNPFLVRLQMTLLGAAVKPSGLTVADLITRGGGREWIDPEHIQQVAPELYAFLEADLGAPLEARDVSIRSLNDMLRYFRTDEETLALLECCEQGNKVLRNRAAHTLYIITGDDIKKACGMPAEALTARLEAVLETALSDYPDANRKRRLDIYAKCDQEFLNSVDAPAER